MGAGTGPRDSQHPPLGAPPSLWGCWQGAQGRAWRTHPEGALGDVDTSPGDDDGVLNGLGGHVGAAEGAVAVGDDLDVDGAAIGVLWASPKARFLEHPSRLRAPRPSQSARARARCWVACPPSKPLPANRSQTSNHRNLMPRALVDRPHPGELRNQVQGHLCGLVSDPRSPKCVVRGKGSAKPMFLKLNKQTFKKETSSWTKEHIH